jgi:hypothetical protein
LAMAEKSSVNEDVLSCGTFFVVDVLGELPELPQAATNSAALLAMATVATALETERKKTTSSVSGQPLSTGLLRAPVGLSRVGSNRLPRQTLEPD